MSAAGAPGLAGRRAVVTGGASGIGAAVVAGLAAAGAQGVVLDIKPAGDAGLPPGWSSLAVDVGDDEALAGAFGVLSAGIDVLVAAAGIVPPWRRIAELDLAEWDLVFRVNTRGVAASLQLATPLLNEGAAVVVIASLNAWRGDPNLASYVASKHALLGLVRSAALDLGRRAIRVNAVGPGPIATEALLQRLARRAADGGPSPDDALAAAGAQTALGRIATVEEVASAAVFLASPASGGVTGQLLAVDAGML